MTQFTIDEGLAALNAESVRVYGEPCNAEQIACFADPARSAEAHRMLDDMETRLGLNVDVAREALIASYFGDFVGVFADKAEFARFIWAQTPDDMRADYMGADEYIDGCLLENNGIYVISARDDGRINVFDVG